MLNKLFRYCVTSFIRMFPKMEHFMIFLVYNCYRVVTVCGLAHLFSWICLIPVNTVYRFFSASPQVMPLVPTQTVSTLGQWSLRMILTVKIFLMTHRKDSINAINNIYCQISIRTQLEVKHQQSRSYVCFCIFGFRTIKRCSNIVENLVQGVLCGRPKPIEESDKISLNLFLDFSRYVSTQKFHILN